MKLKKLLRRKIEPRCAYCEKASPLRDGQSMLCPKNGVVSITYHCGSFRYDPLLRVPPRPAVLRGSFTAADFSIGEDE